MAESSGPDPDALSGTHSLAGRPRYPPGQLSVWLGRLDLNQRIPESESGALPLGYAPIFISQPQTRAQRSGSREDVVTPVGLEPIITSLRGWRPDRIRRRCRWRCGPDSDRRITNLRSVLFDLLSTASWLGWLDSDQRCRNQNPEPYRLATSHGDPRRI